MLRKANPHMTLVPLELTFVLDGVIYLPSRLRFPSSRELFSFLVEEVKPRRSCFCSSFVIEGAVSFLIEEVKLALLTLSHVAFLMSPLVQGSHPDGRGGQLILIPPVGTQNQVLHDRLPIFITFQHSRLSGFKHARARLNFKVPSIPCLCVS